MKGLIMKDLLALRKQGRYLAVVLLFYIIISVFSNMGAVFAGSMAVMAAILPVTAMAYDERARWDKYALSMPVSRADMVISKYLLGLITSAAVLVINTVYGLVVQSQQWGEALSQAVALLAVGVVFLSLVMPILFRFGVEKGRILMMVALFVPTGIVLLISRLSLPEPTQAQLALLIALAPVAAAALLAGSVGLSLSIYRRKEF